jgi:predicted RNA-binding protein associated with RNAse of E/G family
MTEEAIERRVERMMDHLDRVLMSGQITQDNYDKAVQELNQWAEAQYVESALERIAAELVHP